ncbi:MAG: MBL fold metallo-hydrolase [Methanobacterium sp.]|nr:MBL fold metallo-hydrolase [Methanobacterium sp.]
MEIIPGIHELRGRMVNCYLTVDGDELMLIDTGLPGNSSNITEYIENNLNRSPQDIETIVITHNHFDHVGSLSKIKRITGAKVAVHPDDADYIRGKARHAGGAFMNSLIKLYQVIYRSGTVEPDILLKEGDIIGGYRVIHTPGHTEGSICLYNPDKRAIFVGDNLQLRDGKLHSPGKRLIPDPEKYVKSMEKLLEYDIKVILTGHTAPVTSDGVKLIREFLEDVKKELN